MRMTRLAPLALATALAAGCGSEPLRRVDALTPTPAPLEMPQETAREALAQAPICCERIAQMPFQPIAADFAGDVVIDTQAPAFEFASGKSFLRAFALPVDSRSFEIRLYSQAGETVLAPSAMLLDAHFRPTRLLDANDFAYVPATGLKGDSLDTRLRIDRRDPGNPNNERYLVLFTAQDELGQGTTMVHPAKAYAEALGNEPPALPDPVARHAPTGIVKMVLIEEGGARSQADTYVPGYSTGREMGATLPSVAAPVHNVLPETQAYYRQAIDAALAERDLERALRLADEAGRVGDSEARAYLLERIDIK